MKSLIIDAMKKAVTEYEFTDLETAKQVLGWEIAASACRWDKDLMLVDDHGLMKDEPPQAYFMLKEFPRPIATNAIIIGTDEDGETVDVSFGPEYIRNQIFYMSKNDIRMFMENEQMRIDRMRNDPNYKNCVFTTLKEALEN